MPSTIRIGRNSSSQPTKKPQHFATTNPFSLLDEDVRPPTSSCSSIKTKHEFLPPLSQIVWGKGFLHGKSWADELGT
jgi:hypothetical protein